LDEEEVQFAGIGATRRLEEVETEQRGLGDGDECRSRLECPRVDGELRAPPFEPVARVAPMRFGTEREVAEKPCFISPRPSNRNRCAGHHCSGSLGVVRHPVVSFPQRRLLPPQGVSYSMTLNLGCGSHGHPQVTWSMSWVTKDEDKASQEDRGGGT